MKALVADSGLYPDVARNLAKTMEVGYFSNWQNSFPVSREMMPCCGVPNVTRVNEPIRYLEDEKPDLVVVPDLYMNDFEFLTRSMGIPTFGAGEGNKLETDRWALKEFLVNHGLNVVHSVEVQGTELLRRYLEENEDKYVKVSVFRGDLETYHHVKWSSTSVWYEDLVRRLGPVGRQIRFVIEDPIPDAIEVGIDGFFVDGRLLEPFVVGYEIKDSGFIGFVCEGVEALPKGVQEVVAALGEYFAETQYRCFFSNEMRILPNGDVYMTDATCRCPSPPGGAVMKSLVNFTKLVTAIARGDALKPVYSGKYLCEIVLKSDWVAEHFLEVHMENPDDYTFHNYCVIDGETWIIPHDTGYVEFGSALGIADSLDDAIRSAQTAAEAIEGYQVVFDSDVLDKAKDEVEKGRKAGFKD